MNPGLAKVLLFIFSLTDQRIATLRFETTMPYDQCVERLGPIISYATPKITKMLHQNVRIIGTCDKVPG